MTEVAHLTIRLRLFSDRVHNCEHPTAVIERLHQAVSPSVNVLGAWRVPARYDNWSAWKMNANVFCQKRVPPNLFDEWLLLAQKYGQSAMAAKAARDGTPFTWSECMRDLKLSGNGRWVFDELLWPHRMRDGFCCPIGPWVLNYWSSKPLRLSPAARSLLYSAAVSAVEQLMRLTARQRITDAPPAKTPDPPRNRGHAPLFNREPTAPDSAGPWHQSIDGSRSSQECPKETRREACEPRGSLGDPGQSVGIVERNLGRLADCGDTSARLLASIRCRLAAAELLK